MKRWLLIVMFVFLTPILSTGLALAEERRFSLGATVSVVTSTEGSLLGDKIDIERVAMPEAHLIAFMTDSWSVEASYGRYEATVTSESGGVDHGELTVSPLRLTLQYRHNYGNPPPYWDVASYYIAGGIGYYITDFDTDDELKAALSDPTFEIEIKNSVGGHVAAGFDLFLAKHFSFSMELKYWLAQSDIEFEGASGTGDGDFDLDAYSIGAGFKLFL